MRVTIDCRYVRERPSGIGAYTRALVDRLPGLGERDDFELWRHPRAARLSEAVNVRETVVPHHPNSLATLSGLGLAPLGADVFHAPFNILGHGVDCPTVVTVHDLMWLDTPWLCQSSLVKLVGQVPFYRYGITRAIERATRIVAISEATAAAIARRHPSAARRTRVIHHGVEACFRPPDDVEAARVLASRAAGAACFLLVVGQNAPYKNHRAVVEAFAAAGLPRDVMLVLLQRVEAGGPIERAIRRLGLGERVRCRPAASHAELVAMMQTAAALVQYSQNEGFGMPALEAMACGTAVVASDIPTLAEVVGDAGELVPLGRPRMLAEALRRVVVDAAWRAELGARGLERARRFSWDASAAAHLDVYRDAARG